MCWHSKYISAKQYKTKNNKEVIFIMIKPLRDNVVLEKKEVESETKTASGIILKETNKEEPSIAKVVAVGPGIYQDGKLITLDIKEGQNVVYKKYATTEIKVDGKEYYIVSAESILAVVE